MSFFIAAPMLLLGVGVVGLRASHELRIEGKEFSYRNSHLARRSGPEGSPGVVMDGGLRQLKKPRLALESRQALGGPTRWWVLRVDLVNFVEGLALHATPDEDEAKAAHASLLAALGR